MLSTALRYFLEVARSGSLSEASERLHITISAISRQITKLEEDVGAPLFERHPRGMMLTAAGELLADYARRSALEAQRVSDEVRTTIGGVGTLKLATTDGLQRLLTRALVDYHATDSRVQVQLSIVASEEIAPMVRSGEADLGLAFSLLPETDIQLLASWASSICLIVTRDHPLAARDCVDLNELDGHALVLPSDNTLSRIDALFRAETGPQSSSTLMTNSFRVLYDYVAMTNAAGIVSDIVARSQPDIAAYAIVPIREPDLYRRTVQLYAARGRQLPANCARFQDQLIEKISAVAAPIATPG